MAPMTRCRAGSQDEPTALIAEYYGQRASAGLIVSEGVQPSIHGKGYFRTPGIHSDVQVEAWRGVTDVVHESGGAIVMQMMHCGRVGSPANKHSEAEIVAPSAIRCRSDVYTAGGMAACPEPRALETQEIANVIDEHVAAARNALRAGFDGVELHCTSGYLPMQFLSSASNHRTDRYGGSPENRARFVIETLEAMAAAIGPGRVSFRISPGNAFNDIADETPVESYSALLKAVDRLGLAYIHVINAPIPQLDPMPFVRSLWSGGIIGNGDLDSASAEKMLAGGLADAASFGRLYISNPDLVERFRLGAALNEPNRRTFYMGEDKGFTDYPALVAAKRFATA